MIPDITPVNTWAGNGSTTTFDFDFLINNDSELQVLHTSKDGFQTELKLNRDYTINQVGNENGSYITFPILGSSYKVLGEDEKISLVLNIPIAQSSPYGTSSKLNLKALEHSLDYIVRLIQIESRKNDRAVKVQEGSNINTDKLAQDLTTVADNISHVETISANIGNVEIVSNSITNVNTVAGSISNVNIVGNDILNVDAVAENKANIDAVKNNAANINTVAGSIGNVNIVGNDILNIDAVVKNKANIDAVKNNATNINTCAINIEAIKNAKTNAEIATRQANIAKQKAQETESAAQIGITNINTIKNNALSAIGENDSTGARGTAINAIKTQQSASSAAVANVGNSAVKNISSMQQEIEKAKNDSKEFYQKAVGWNIQYETDGEEDCLVFEDRTQTEINQAKNYIEDTRDKAITSIQTKTTEGVNTINSTRDSVVNAVKTQGDKSVATINSTKDSATSELTQIANSAKNSITNTKTQAEQNITTIKNQAVTEVRNASATNINTATSNGLNEITKAKNSAVSACAEQVALAKGYAQQANGWDFSYQDETLVFTRNEV